jgi:hypothetical protein
MADIPEDDVEDTDVSEDEDEAEAEPSEAEQRTIREVMAEHVQDQRKAQAAAEFARQRKAQDERVAQQRARKEREEHVERAARTRVAAEARLKVQAELVAAGRSLAKAARLATSVPLPRFSAEGMEQRRLVRAVEEISGALRKAMRLAGRSFSEGFDDATKVEEPVSAETVETA